MRSSRSKGMRRLDGLDRTHRDCAFGLQIVAERGAQARDADGDWFRAEEEIRRRQVEQH